MKLINIKQQQQSQPVSCVPLWVIMYLYCVEHTPDVVKGVSTWNVLHINQTTDWLQVPDRLNATLRHRPVGIHVLLRSP